MRQRFFASGRPLVFAHRGGAGLAPENTFAAFDAGMRAGADGLELDVRASRDGAVVVHHDRTLDRTMRRPGEVARFTADELAAMGVPRLADVLARHRDCRVIVEMKIDDPRFAEAVVEVVRTAGAVDRVCVGSFGARAVRAARRLEPALATSASREEVRRAVYRGWLRCPVSLADYGGYQVPEAAEGTRIVTPRFVRYAHEAGLAVQVWTVNAVEDARRLLAWGVHGLITDRPDLIVPIIRS